MHQCSRSDDVWRLHSSIRYGDNSSTALSSRPLGINQTHKSRSWMHFGLTNQQPSYSTSSLPYRAQPKEHKNIKRQDIVYGECLKYFIFVYIFSFAWSLYLPPSPIIWESSTCRPIIFLDHIVRERDISEWDGWQIDIKLKRKAPRTKREWTQKNNNNTNNINNNTERMKPHTAYNSLGIPPLPSSISRTYLLVSTNIWLRC